MGAAVGVPSFGPPKTDTSVRIIPLPQVVVGALAGHLAEFPPGEHGLIFTAVDGRPVNRDNVTRAFRAAIVGVGARSDARLRDLPHYYASLLIRHGESAKVVEARLGDASARKTLDTYAHLLPDSEDLTRAAVDGVVGAASADSVRTDSAT